MAALHHRSAIYEGYRSLVGLRESDLGVFKRSDTLNAAFFSSRSIGGFQTHSRVYVKLDSNTRVNGTCSTGADETRVIKTKNYHYPIMTYPFIDRPDRKLAHPVSWPSQPVLRD